MKLKLLILLAVLVVLSGLAELSRGPSSHNMGKPPDAFVQQPDSSAHLVAI